MFKLAHYIGYEYGLTGETLYIVEILDDDFQEVIKLSDFLSVSQLEVKAIIMCYSSKNLDVAKNLLIYMKKRSHFGISITHQLEWYKELSLFKQYLPEMQKYLNLL